MNEVRIEFTQWNSDNTRVDLEFIENESEMDIFKFHDLCVRFAAAAGYTDESIKRAFMNPEPDFVP